MKSNSRTLILAGLLLVVFLLVVGDMLLRSGRDRAGTPASDRLTLLNEQQEALAEKRRLLDSADQLATDAQRVNELWTDALGSMIKAQTASIAQSALREHILNAVREVAPDVQAGVPRFAEQSIDGVPGIRRLALDLTITATSPADLYTIIDRIENDPEIRIGITRITMEGPGIQQGVVKAVTTTLSIEALAVVGGEDA